MTLPSAPEVPRAPEPLEKLRSAIASVIGAECVLARSTCAPSSPRHMSDRSRAKRRAKIKENEATANKANDVLWEALKESESLLGGLRQEVATLRRDSERIDLLGRWLFASHWDGCIGRPSSWSLVGHHRHILAGMSGHCFREALDATLAKAEALAARSPVPGSPQERE